MIKQKDIKSILKLFSEGLLNSYSQVFFSNNKVFAVLLLLVSFFDVGAGISGVISIIVSQLLSYFFNFSKELIRDGSYTYNSLMVGMSLGLFYEFNLSLVIILVISSFLSVLVVVFIASSLNKRGLPFMSIPFILVIWIIILGADNFTGIALNQKEIFSLEVYFPSIFVATNNFISAMPFADAFHLYFRSIAAIFFQYNDLTGVIIVIGILYYSRISFILSLLGFFIGYSFYLYFEGDFSNLVYSYIGFNFILTAIALGGFFLVPSRKTFFSLFFIIPIVAILLSAFHPLFASIGLPLYSLPFNIVGLLFLGALRYRFLASGLEFVVHQQFSPEKNHYSHYNSVQKYKDHTYIYMNPPIIGEWSISQSYDGEYTHKDDWRHALDFVIRDEYGKTFDNSGVELSDYYCYELPILAPAAGWVVEIIDGIEDNKIGEVDLANNWGNLIIIKHAEGLYTKLAHLKKDSFQVKKGDYIYPGAIVAYLGSSGRSPEPHLHYQVQSTPFIGGKTIHYPLSFYLSGKAKDIKFNQFSIPQKDEKIRAISPTKILLDAFNFTRKKKLTFQVEGTEEIVEWEFLSTMYNETYLHCKKTDAIAYFINNGKTFYFTKFFGDKSSYLHHLYLGVNKVLLSYNKNIVFTEQISFNPFFNFFIKGFHDFTAPFFHYLKGEYYFSFGRADDDSSPSEIEIETKCYGIMINKKTKEINYKIKINNKGIEEICINNKVKLKCI